MTVQDIINKIERNDTWSWFSPEEQALIKLELEKQVAKKPIGKHTDYKCSVCGRRVRSGKGSSSRQRDNFCQRCGTKIDWSEEDD